MLHDFAAQYTAVFGGMYHALGIAGFGIILFGILAPAIAFSGKRGERYSIFNHYISELGEMGVSKYARVFNGGLILGGLLLVPFIIQLGLMIDNLWAKLALLAGLWTTISVIFVGIFPMNNLTRHTNAAIAYFRGGLVMVTLFGIAILLQPKEQVVVSKYAVIASVLATAAYGAFLTLVRPSKPAHDKSEENVLDPESIPERPAFWMNATLEWLVFFSTLVWFFAIAVLT
jgi:hypothetical membrane protein